VTALADALGLIRAVPDFPEPGVLFRDLSPLFADGPALRVVAEEMAARLPEDTEVLAAVEARGFLLAGAISMVSGVGVALVRKPGKLPVVADRVDYALEYGTATLELPVDVVRAGQRVVVVDDVLATGGTAAATGQLVERAGGVVLGVSVVLELAALSGRSALRGHRIDALLSV
jgi:adenine phosphoribosyltransferase